MRVRVTVSAALVLSAFFVLVAATGAEAQFAIFLSFDSQFGDWVGGGQKLTLTFADGTFSLSRIFDQGVSVSFDGGGSFFWHLSFAAPHGRSVVGLPHTARPNTINNPADPMYSCC
jgi:hypothetical protein